MCKDKENTEQDQTTAQTAETAEETQTDVPSEENKSDESKTADKKKKDKKESKKDKKNDELKQLQEKLESQKESYMRLAAEYDNYRKRTANEKLSIYDDATAKAVEELLPVADSMQMALQSLADAPDEVKKGIELVNQQLEKSFEKLKITSFGEVGDDFDPQLHNAVSRVENEELGENQIASVFQKGYKIGDKVIRHAMVQVANCD
ncbi:MAG: nucleotide exchange factor GrpE [bacterium]|nr:nucleotide exchange factor GrpE [bacterium]MDY3861896.1 nucleotide exchange factor GrpE [Ruminococcus sp.]